MIPLLQPRAQHPWLYYIRETSTPSAVKEYLLNHAAGFIKRIILEATLWRVKATVDR